MTINVDEKEQKGKSKGPMPEPGEPQRDGDARTRGAHARDDEIVTDGDDDTAGFDLEALIDLWVDEAKKTAARVWAWLSRDRGLLSEHPASLAHLGVYWWRAPLAGASALLRWIQRLDGFTFGLGFTLSGYSWAWIGQRPLRRYCFLLLAFIVWRFQ